MDRSKGFALLIDSQGALHLETVNVFYGKRVRTSSPPAVAPLNEWVHVAGVSATFPVSARRLYVNGREVAAAPIAWGEGIAVHGDEEQEPQPLYVGNNDTGAAGLAGWIDQLRIHRNVVKFWENEDVSWTDPKGERALTDGPPYFVPEHRRTAHLPLDGDPTASGAPTPDFASDAAGGSYVPGVRGQAYSGRVAMSAPNLLDFGDGAVEFWMKPVGVNNYSDRNVGFVNSPFVFYIFNGGHGPRPLTLYFDDGNGLHFVNADAGDVHPGRWLHVVITWRDADITVFIDGKEAGKTSGRKLAPGGKATANELVLNGYGSPAIVDEVRVYPHALLPEEAANAYFCYRDAAKLVAGVRMPSVDILAEYLPSLETVYYQLRPNVAVDTIRRVNLSLLAADGKPVRHWQSPWPTDGRGELELPKLADGRYVLATAVMNAEGKTILGGKLPLYRKHFPWEDRKLGFTDEVFPPFTPVRVEGRSVEVVSRRMTMNGFGLWDEAISLDRNLLAAPMQVRFETVAGAGAWGKMGGDGTLQRPWEAVFEGQAAAPALQLKTRSRVELDGCMKVDMTLAPGDVPTEVTKLWIEVPLRDREVPLMHTIGDGLRHNYAGATPTGQGVVWDGSKVRRSGPWRNNFVPYVWLGAAERGLAFFAENDKGWVTEKGKSHTPTHELIREGDRLTLRVCLINAPVTLAQPRELTFGLQASPTKPMPPDWRRKLPDCPGGLAVVPWGGLQCASQGPWGDDWTLVDKLVETRHGNPFDEQWFAAYQQAHKLPLVHGTSDWTYLQGHFASRAAAAGLDKPIAVYQEEMRAAHSRPEWIVFQDEWKASDGPQPRTGAEGIDLAGGHRSLSGVSQITFPPSYADFGCWIANEWLQRGISLYWDNYWEDEPVLGLDNDQVKWLALVKRKTGAALLVLASWSEEPTQAMATLNATALGFDPARTSVSDAETGETIAKGADKPFRVPLPGPLGNRVLRLAVRPRQ